jgi:hypothetical protein
MPIAPSATLKHTIAFRQCKAFPMDAKVEVISTHNPWRRNAISWNLFEKVLRQKTHWTVEEILSEAEKIGYFRSDAARHLRWLYTWGDFIEVNGQRHFPKEPEVEEKKPEPAPIKIIRPHQPVRKSKRHPARKRA